MYEIRVRKQAGKQESGSRRMDELTHEFLIESHDGLDRMEHCLTELEDRPGDKEILGEIFRAVHTIKGTTGFLGFTRLEKLAHAGENILGLLRDGKLAANQPIITGLLQLLDGLRDILRTIESENSEGEEADTQLIATIQDLMQPSSDQEQAPSKSSPATPPFHLEPAAEIPTIIDPSANPSKSQQAHRNPKAKPPATPAAETTLRVSVALFNRMMNLVGELVLSRNQILQATAHDPALAQLSSRLDTVTADLRESVMQARMQPVANIFSKFTRIVRDLSQMLDRQVRLELEGQETELDKSLLEAIKDPLTHAVRNSLDHGIEPPHIRIANGKDPEGVLKLRACQESGHVVIEVSDDGAGIGVDRVRSKAIERGLITPEHAAQLGEKDLLQLIFLPGFSTAEAITNVSGRGVGMDVVRTNIEQIGGKVEIESRPGNGTILRFRIPLTLAIIPALIIRSAGHSFALPQGALLELVHVSATGPGNPSSAADSIEWIESTPLYRLRGRLLPLIFLDHLLNPASSAVTHSPSLPPVVLDPSICEVSPSQALHGNNFIAVLDVDGLRFGLVVDDLGDPEEIVVKPLSPVLKSIGLYSGAAILGTGDLALILDLSAIASRAGVAPPARRIAPELDAQLAANPTGTQFLLVQVAGSSLETSRAAIPLAQVVRIERLPRSRIEFAASRPLLNVDSQMLPVGDHAKFLAAHSVTDPNAQVTLIVCRDRSRQVAVTVSDVLDVAVGQPLFETGSIQPARGMTLLDGRVTPILDLEFIPSVQSSGTQTHQQVQSSPANTSGLSAWDTPLDSTTGCVEQKKPGQIELVR